MAKSGIFDLSSIYDFGEPSTALYVMVMGEGITKIGISKNPGNRNYHMQVSSGIEICIFWAIRLSLKNAKKLEKDMHRALKRAKLHARGEWFYIDPVAAVRTIQSEILRRKYRSMPDICYGIFRGEGLTPERKSGKSYISAERRGRKEGEAATFRAIEAVLAKELAAPVAEPEKEFRIRGQSLSVPIGHHSGKKWDS